MATVATEQAAERGDGLRDSRHRPFGSQSNPAEKIVRAARDAEQGPSVRQLIQRCRGHGDLGRMLRERIDDARAELNAVGAACRRCQQHPCAAQEEVVAYPEGIEACLLGALRQLRVALDWQVVVEADAKAHRLER